MNDLSEKIDNKLYIILINYSNDLEEVKKREGKLPADYAVIAIKQLIQDAQTEARIDARTKLLNKLARTYKYIPKPSKHSAMELTDEAKFYNKFRDDLQLFIDKEVKP